MRRFPPFLFALAALPALACSSKAPMNVGTGVPPGPAAWNRKVIPPSDSDAQTKRTACAYQAGSLPAETQGASIPSGAAIPVDHIIVVMMENRSFDHYFSKLPENGQTDVDPVPAGYTNPDGMGNMLPPTHDQTYCFVDTNHSWAGSHQQYDSGKMDGFFASNQDNGTPPAHPLATSMSGARALFYYDNTDIPFYYWLANQFSIADHYHASLLGPTWPNRMYLYGSTSRGQTDNIFVDFHDQKGLCTSDSMCGGAAGSCVMESVGGDVGGSCKGTCKVDADCGLDAQMGACDVAGGGACLPVGRTIFDYMEQRQLNWKVYAEGTPGFGLLLTTWLEYRALHQFDLTDFMNDAAAGTLPDVAFVDPNLGNEVYDGDDEHPPGMPQGGQSFTANVIDLLTKSPNWSSSALFLTYDEHGGLWDHVPPPPACPPDSIPPALGPGDPNDGFDRYGIRVPMMVVSPYAKTHYVSHQVYDHTSIVRFIQARFVMPAITNRDANALAPWDMFDFGSPPKPPPSVTVPDIDLTGQNACAKVFAP